MFRVFVYGTLKLGEPNHHWLRTTDEHFSKFICKGKSVKKYPLIIGTKYNIPFLLDTPGSGHHVEGEVYEVDEKMLHNLDILEDHPNFYVRREEEIQFIDDDESIKKCWTYFLTKFKPELLKKEMFVSYSSRGSHNLVYLERSARDPNYNWKAEVLTN